MMVCDLEDNGHRLPALGEYFTPKTVKMHHVKLRPMQGQCHPTTRFSAPQRLPAAQLKHQTHLTSQGLLNSILSRKEKMYVENKCISGNYS